MAVPEANKPEAILRWLSPPVAGPCMASMLKYAAALLPSPRQPTCQVHQMQHARLADLVGQANRQQRMGARAVRVHAGCSGGAVAGALCSRREREGGERASRGSGANHQSAQRNLLKPSA